MPQRIYVKLRNGLRSASTERGRRLPYFNSCFVILLNCTLLWRLTPPVRYVYVYLSLRNIDRYCVEYLREFTAIAHHSCHTLDAFTFRGADIVFKCSLKKWDTHPWSFMDQLCRSGSSAKNRELSRGYTGPLMPVCVTKGTADSE